MKLRIMEQMLEEDIEAVKKYYPNIEDSTFMQLIALDPTYRDGSNSVGKYGKWILNLFKKGAISKEDFSEITPLLQQFTTYKNRVQNKDLNAYKTLDDLSNTLAQVVDDDSMLSDRQKLRFLKNVKAGRISTAAEDDYDVVLNTPKFIVYVPNTHEASMKLGKGTAWYTAHENPMWFDSYTKDAGKLYIVKNKKTGERWQYSDLRGDFLDSNDKKFNIFELLAQDMQLAKYFVKFGFTIPTELELDEDGYYLYTGKPISNNLIQHISKIKIDSSVKYIPDNAFREYFNLMYVTIPNGVTKIGDGAFEECYNLISVDIPNSVVEIGRSAFKTCLSLAYITIPNSITVIEDSVFKECRELNKIIIPNTVVRIADNAFDSCYNLSVYTNNDYVIDYCDRHDIFVRVTSSNNESYTRKLRLRIKEDTACIASKTSYMNEDGLDANGIYYFGKKPEKPLNWKEYKPKKLKIKE